jgi:hypothetical protein
MFGATPSGIVIAKDPGDLSGVSVRLRDGA